MCLHIMTVSQTEMKVSNLSSVSEPVVGSKPSQSAPIIPLFINNFSHY